MKIIGSVIFIILVLMWFVALFLTIYLFASAIYRFTKPKKNKTKERLNITNHEFYYLPTPFGFIYFQKPQNRTERLEKDQSSSLFKESSISKLF